MSTRKRPPITASAPKPCHKRSQSLGGKVAGLAHIEKDKEPVELYFRAPLAERVGCDTSESILIPSVSGSYRSSFGTG